MKNKLYILIGLFILIQGCDLVSTNDEVEVDRIDKPTVTITFDDVTKSQTINAYPIIENYDMVATSYINSDFVGRGTYRSNINELQGLVNSGWELGTHTLKHDDMTQLSSDSVIINLEEPKEYLESNFGIEVHSYASPYGLFNNSIIREVEKRYTTHVNAYSSYNGVNNVRSVDPMNIHRFDVTQEVSVLEVCGQISRLDSDEWFVLLFHNVRTPEVGYWDNSIEKFEEIVKCINKSDVDVRNITEMYSLIQEQFPTPIESVNMNYNMYNTLPDSISEKYKNH